MVRWFVNAAVRCLDAGTPDIAAADRRHALEYQG
jgi:hypothetical protein